MLRIAASKNSSPAGIAMRSGRRLQDDLPLILPPRLMPPASAGGSSIERIAPCDRDEILKAVIPPVRMSIEIYRFTGAIPRFQLATLHQRLDCRLSLSAIGCRSCQL